MWELQAVTDYDFLLCIRMYRVLWIGIVSCFYIVEPFKEPGHRLIVRSAGIIWNQKSIHGHFPNALLTLEDYKWGNPTPNLPPGSVSPVSYEDNKEVAPVLTQRSFFVWHWPFSLKERSRNIDTNRFHYAPSCVVVEASPRRVGMVLVLLKHANKCCKLRSCFLHLLLKDMSQLCVQYTEALERLF